VNFPELLSCWRQVLWRRGFHRILTQILIVFQVGENYSLWGTTALTRLSLLNILIERLSLLVRTVAKRQKRILLPSALAVWMISTLDNQSMSDHKINITVMIVGRIPCYSFVSLTLWGSGVTIDYNKMFLSADNCGSEFNGLNVFEVESPSLRIDILPRLKTCLLPTTRVRILAERDRRARLRSSVSTASISLWNNCSEVDYRRSVTPTAGITVWIASRLDFFVQNTSESVWNVRLRLHELMGKR